MPWRGPQYPGEFPSLGWSLLEWWADFLPAPSDPDAPLLLTDEQARLVVRWWALDPVTGALRYRRGCSRRSKGWGKSPLEAAKALAELAGPVRFAGWDARGDPVGRPWGTAGDPSPWVQIAACSEDQTDNTYGALYEALTANDGRAADDLRIDVGLTRCFLTDRPGRLEPVTASAGSREGQRVTYATLDETHLWLPSNGGRKLARTLRRNVAKMSGRSYETTNSYTPGERSVAEDTHKAADQGAAGLFYDAVEAPEVREDAPDTELRAALAVAYGDAHWVDLDRLVAEIRDPDTEWEEALRFFFNRPTDDRLKAVEAARWTALARPDIQVPHGARVGLGFDGSISDDATALRGCVLLHGKPHTFVIRVWTRPPNAPRGWRIPRTEVHETVAWAFDHYQVGLMLCDPAKWHTEIEGWAQAYGEDRVVFFDTNSLIRMSRACDRWLTAVAEGAYSHDGDPVTTDHVLAMHRKKVHVRDADDDGRTKYVFVKGPDRRKIDAGISDVLALQAAVTMPDQPPAADPWALYG
ncbi:terminase [Actinocrispum wychmicini]|uniref:Phage terminase large subunit-like protein n=1 Tax=Actinocrispum wychmicini TaxID=1213861 RepID=A0A4V2S494_9PSEU|nr:terminase [Actinocrispum wychmicini]TCO47310.1 phage terminase large subunit-like protein [Actinocrispum wychmicini]